MALKYNPLLEDNFQELNPAGPGGGVSLAATLVLGNTTGGRDIILSGSGLTADTITGAGTTNSINLNDPDGGWSVSSDDTAYNESYVFGDSLSAYLAFGISQFITTANSILMKNTGGSMIGQPFSYLSPTNIGVGDDANVGIIYNIKIKNNGTLSGSTVSDGHVFINSGGLGILTSSIAAGVDRTVVVAGQGITAKTDNTLYTNQISLQPSSNTFDGMLAPSAITADRTWTMPDKSGTVAMLSDVAEGLYTQTGQTTDGTQFTLPLSYPLSTISGNQVISFIIRITTFQSAGSAGTIGDVWIHELRGAIKKVGSLVFVVDTVTDESIAEDIGASGFSATVDIGLIPYAGIDVKVTGELNKTIEWKAVGIFNEIVI
jgi:hypothetical protein